MTLADGLPRNSVDAKVAATVESAAWPSTASGGITLDVFNTYIGELQAAANAQAGWTDADDELIARLTAELETAVKEVRKEFQGEARGREVDRILTEHFAYRRRHYPELVARENAARLAHNGLKWPRLQPRVPPDPGHHEETGDHAAGSGRAGRSLNGGRGPGDWRRPLPVACCGRGSHCILPA